MSVSKVPSASILQTVEKAQTPDGALRQSLFELFGTTNCGLNCEALHEFEKNKLEIALVHPNRGRAGRPDRQKARKEWSEELRSSQQSWFKLKGLEDSAAKGCGSCEVLCELFHLLFSESQGSNKDKFEYAVSSSFVLQERFIGHQQLPRSVTIFQPPGEYHVLGFRT